MLLQDDEDQVRRARGLIHSASSLALLGPLIAYLYTTGAYISLGHFSQWPLAFLIFSVELVKWSYFQYQKETLSCAVSGRKGDSSSPFLKVLSFSSIWGGAFTFFAGVFFWSALAILFGAALFDKSEETFMFGLLMSTLTAAPISLHLGSGVALKVPVGWRPTTPFQTLLYRNSVGAAVGAWLGAFLFPLDWDRPYQEWPIPSSFGALIAFTLSHLYNLVETLLSNTNISSRTYRKRR